MCFMAQNYNKLTFKFISGASSCRLELCKIKHSVKGGGGPERMCVNCENVQNQNRSSTLHVNKIILEMDG